MHLISRTTLNKTFRLQLFLEDYIGNVRAFEKYKRILYKIAIRRQTKGGVTYIY